MDEGGGGGWGGSVRGGGGGGAMVGRCCIGGHGGRVDSGSAAGAMVRAGEEFQITCGQNKFDSYRNDYRCAIRDDM